MAVSRKKNPTADDVASDPQLSEGGTDVAESTTATDSSTPQPGGETYTPNAEAQTDDAVPATGDPQVDLSATTDTTAPKEPWFPDPSVPRVAAPTGQSKEVAEANIATAEKKVVGTVHKLLSDSELEAELLDEKFSDLEPWVVKHFEARDATIDSMARVTRLGTEEIKNILKEAGVRFPEGM